MKKEGEEIKKELQHRMTGYIVGALGLVAGLAWNDAIKALIEYLFPLAKNTLLAKFIYAILMTFIIGIVASYLIRFFDKKEENK
ncbi:MAG: hypothetical protein AUJ39_02100 [Parcubacteria group bacterium CG1_02_42_13]|nr:MAG: hypothetical protein AUJ39_02100 [Parcubacteria group bacterium CG1_02_42_13]